MSELNYFESSTRTDIKDIWSNSLLENQDCVFKKCCEKYKKKKKHCKKCPKL